MVLNFLLTIILVILGSVSMFPVVLFTLITPLLFSHNPTSYHECADGVECIDTHFALSEVLLLQKNPKT